MILLGTLNRILGRKQVDHEATVNWHADRATEGMKASGGFPKIPQPRSGNEDEMKPSTGSDET